MPRKPKPLDPAIAGCRGLPPQRRAELIAEAKQVAMRFRWAVTADNAAEIYRLVGARVQCPGCEFLAALSLVLAEGVKPGDLRLLAVTKAVDDGMPERGEVA
jgi:hypothetical protein